MHIRSTRLLRAALAIALALTIATAPAFASSIPVRLNSSARVYQKISASSRSVKVPKNLKVTLKAYKNGWGMITYKGHVGFIQLKYLDRCKPLKAYVKTSSAVYSGVGSGKLGTAGQGAVVYVLGINGKYAHIQNKSGSRKGYIKASALSATKVNAGGSSASAVPKSLRAGGGSNVEKVIYVAQAMMGKPYSEKAKPPKSFDCARLTYYCYNAVKKGSLGGSSKSQGYDDRYATISYGDLKRGDLVCFDTVSDSDKCDHVGIYLGSGYFIHASSSAGQVILSSLKSGYYKRTFSWGKRIF